MSQILGALALSLATILGAYIAARYAGKSTVKAAKVTVEGEAFTRAQEIYVGSIKELTAEQGRHKQAIADLTAEVGTLRSSVSRYEQRVIQLEGTLRAHRIPVPAWLRSSNLALVEDHDPNRPDPITEPEE